MKLLLKNYFSKQFFKYNINRFNCNIYINCFSYIFKRMDFFKSILFSCLPLIKIKYTIDNKSIKSRIKI